MNIMHLGQRPAGRGRSGPYLGHHGHRRLYHVSDFGCGRSDGGWHHGHWRRHLYHADHGGRSLPAALLGAFLAGMLAGLVTGLFHTACGIPAILAGILTQLALYSVNLRIMGQANRPISSRQYTLLVDQQSVRSLSLENPIFTVAIL